MQSILRWSLENSTPLDESARDRPPTQRTDLDPGIIDMILGKPDAVQMKEDMDVAADWSKTEEERIAALDHLEMLIENIDNANDLQKLGLWEPLQTLLMADTSTPEIKMQTLWVIGTALQNNPSAQDVYLSYKPLPVLTSFLEPSSSSSTSSRAKAIYAMSGLLKHNAPALEALGKSDVEGWSKLRDALQDPAITVRRKVIFLLSTLLVPSSATKPSSRAIGPAPVDVLRITENPDTSSASALAHSESSAPNILTPDHRPEPISDPIHPNSHAASLRSPSRTNTSGLTQAAFREHRILDVIISSVTSPLPHGDDGENTDADPDFEEKAVHLLHTYVATCRGELSIDQKVTLRNWIQEEKNKEGEKQLLEKWGLEREEYSAFFGKLL